jgi:hypothetical protein
VSRLQSGGDAECQLFQKIARQGRAGGRPGVSQQGTYVVAPSGILLADLNSSDPVRMREMLARGLERWKQLPREERLGPELPVLEQTDARRPERFYPEGGLVLRVSSRDLPRENAPARPGADWRQTAWNHDYAWFRPEEARQIVPEKAAVGEKSQIPAALIRRLARCNLVDNVRGETQPYLDAHIQRAEWQSEVVKVEGRQVTLRLTGETRAFAEGMWSIGGLRRPEPTPQKRGHETKLLGRATYDLEKRKFVAFEMLALGTRWGGSQFNQRADDLDPAPIGTLFVLAGDTPAERVAPAFLRHYGWE